MRLLDRLYQIFYRKKEPLDYEKLIHELGMINAEPLGNLMRLDFRNGVHILFMLKKNAKALKITNN